MCFLFSRLVCAEEKPFNFSSLFYVIFLPFYYLYCISYILISFSHIILFLFSLSTWKKKSVYLTCGHNTRTQIFDVLLTVHLSTISAIDQLNAQKSSFIISLLYASTCFEHYVLIIGRSKLYYTASGIITPLGGRPVHTCTRAHVLSTCARDGHLQV